MYFWMYMYCVSVCIHQWQKMTLFYIWMARWINKTTGAKLPWGAVHCWDTWVAFQPNGSLGESPKGKRSDQHPEPCELSRDNREPWPLTAALLGGSSITWMKIESKHPMDKDYSYKEMVKRMKFHTENVKNGRKAALQGSLVTLLWFIAPFSSDKLMSGFALPCPDFPTFSSATVVDESRGSHTYTQSPLGLSFR